jgi:sugar lactone lactonase YvrE
MKHGTWAFSLLFFSAAAVADMGPGVSTTTSFSTLITTPLGIEGLTGDYQGNLYTPGRAPAGQPCPVWRINIAHPTLVVVGNIPPPSATTACSPSGLAFGPDGKLYVTQSDNNIYRFTPSDTGTPPIATVFATNVPGNNGLAFDWNGNLWTGDGTTGLGRVWRITPDGTATEVFRIQPMANTVTGAPSGVTAVGRSAVTLPPGTAQPLVANGLQFGRDHNLYIVDTARGAVWRVHVKQDSSVDADMGCDQTFPADTLCLSQVWVQHPYLEGADGFVMDTANNLWVDANERNAVIFVFNPTGEAVEVFRNPVDAVTMLRNAGPLETPTSPVLDGHTLCTANSDGNRRDNSPSTDGEIGGAGQPKGKISCMNQRVTIPGRVLPVQH